MSDLPERLREATTVLDVPYHEAAIEKTCLEAADEIDRLRTEVRLWKDAAHLISRWMAEGSDETHTQIIKRVVDRIGEVRAPERRNPQCDSEVSGLSEDSDPDRRECEHANTFTPEDSQYIQWGESKFCEDCRCILKPDGSVFMQYPPADPERSEK